MRLSAAAGKLLVVAVICVGVGLAYRGAAPQAAGETAESLLQAAEQSLAAGAYGEAERDCLAVIAQFPSSEVEARALLGEVYFAQGQPEAAGAQAELALAKLASLSPAEQERFASWPGQLLRLVQAREDFAQQSAALQQTLAEAAGSPEAAEARYRLGSLYALYFQYARAAQELGGLLETTPASPLAYKAFRMLTVVLGLAAQPAEAAALPELVRTHYGQDAEMQLALMRWYVEQGQVESLRAAAEELVTARPDSAQAAPALLLLGRAYDRQGQREAAVAVAERLVAHYPQSPATPQALVELADAYASSGDTPQAESWASRLLAGYPDSPAVIVVVWSLERAYLAAGGEVAAANRLRALAAAHPQTSLARASAAAIDGLALAHYTLGMRLGQAGHYPEAASEFAQALAVAPSVEPAVAALYQQAIAYQAQGQKAQALAAFAQVQQDYPQHYLSTRAQAWREKIQAEQ